jgi:hypothetical protein
MKKILLLFFILTIYTQMSPIKPNKKSAGIPFTITKSFSTNPFDISATLVKLILIFRNQTLF